MNKKFNYSIPDELYEMVTIFAKKYNVTISGMITMLVEMSILDLLGGGENSEIKFKEISK